MTTILSRCPRSGCFSSADLLYWWGRERVALYRRVLLAGLGRAGGGAGGEPLVKRDPYQFTPANGGGAGRLLAVVGLGLFVQQMDQLALYLEGEDSDVIVGPFAVLSHVREFLRIPPSTPFLPAHGGLVFGVRCCVRLHDYLLTTSRLPFDYPVKNKSTQAPFSAPFRLYKQQPPHGSPAFSLGGWLRS